MSLDIEDQTQKSHRPLVFAVLGLLLIGIAAYILYGAWSDRKSDTPSNDAYSYGIKQSVYTDVRYLPSSFYANGPGPTNKAYVNELTDKIGTVFHYRYTASEETELTYSYSVKGIVRGSYVLGDSKAAESNVWTKEYQLIKPTTKTVVADTIQLDPSVNMPYAEYKKSIDQFKNAFNLPINTEAKVVCTIRVKGTVNGVPFTDNRELTVSAPLNLQIYQLAVKYDKSDKKEVNPPAVSNSWDMSDHFAEILGGVLAFLGIVSLIYGLRRQIFKSSYQRELDRIYRYHDGIIIRANKPADIDDKKAVSVQSFDDMLNLEEELKVPIVASPAGSEAMHFVIIRDDVVYVYTLGKPVLDRASVNKVQDEISDYEETYKKPPKRKKK